MKIGLVTIFNSTNYGAVLQAYATKKALSKYGKVNLINYDSDYLSNHFELVRFNFSIHGCKMLVHDILRLPYSIFLFKKFKNFITQELNPSIKYTKEDLDSQKAKQFDVLVAGSDQIWNPDVVDKNGHFDSTYYLTFASQDQMKFSFASSIGHHFYSQENKRKVAKALQDFTQISVREKDGISKIEEILPDKKIKHINDPTLLLSKSEWLDSLNIKESKNVEDYILVYSVPHSDLMKKAVLYFSNKFNLKIITIDKMLLPFTKTNKHIRNAGPRDYIKLFAEAKFIITDSFHGTCFSVNFSKPFVSISPGKKSNRISSLLSLLNLEKNMISKENEFEQIGINLDYSQIQLTLEKIREDSKQYIQNTFII